ncbi:MAG: hypothetical protein JSW50_12580, partial [Candidatus Latescibacterota bacterium]
MKRIFPFAAVVVLLGAWGCGGGDEAGVHDEAGSPSVVQTFEAVTLLAEEPVEYSASVQPADKANIAGKVMGRIEKLNV